MPPIEPHVLTASPDPWAQAMALWVLGGPAIWAIAGLSVLVLSCLIWKMGDLLAMGAVGGQARAWRAVALWQAGDRNGAQAMVSGLRGARADLARQTMQAMSQNPARAEDLALAAARRHLARASYGLRFLELAAAIAPLMGLFGTVTGMIAAFRGLQAAGVQADTATLAGGIWEALLTTAAGMAVAIPAMVAQSLFESLAEALRRDMEDIGTALLTTPARTSAAPRPVVVARGPGWAQAAAEAVARAHQPRDPG